MSTTAPHLPTQGRFSGLCNILAQSSGAYVPAVNSPPHTRQHDRDQDMSLPTLTQTCVIPAAPSDVGHDSEITLVQEEVSRGGLGDNSAAGHQEERRMTQLVLAVYILFLVFLFCLGVGCFLACLFTTVC